MALTNASSTHAFSVAVPQAQGADCEGYRYYAQLALEGVPYQKPKHRVGTATIGLDLGPSTLAMVPKAGEARLLSFCQELKTDKQKKRRLQRKLDRQRRANNQENYDAKGRVKKGKLRWKESQGYKVTRRRLASQERKFAAHRKSLHGRPLYCPIRLGECGDALAGSNRGCPTTCECGEALPQSFGMPRARARLPQSLVSDHQELRYQHGRLEAVARWQAPPHALAGGVSVSRG